MIHSWTKPRHFTQGFSPLCLRCSLRVKSEKMDIEKAVQKASSHGVRAVVALAERLGEKSYVAYDILERTDPEMYDKVRSFFED